MAFPQSAEDMSTIAVKSARFCQSHDISDLYARIFPHHTTLALACCILANTCLSQAVSGEQWSQPPTGPRPWRCSADLTRLIPEVSGCVTRICTRRRCERRGEGAVDEFPSIGRLVGGLWKEGLGLYSGSMDHLTVVVIDSVRMRERLVSCTRSFIRTHLGGAMPALGSVL